MTDEAEANRESGAVSEQDSFLSRIMQEAPAEPDKPVDSDDDEAEDVEHDAEAETAEEEVSEADDDADAADEPAEDEAEPEDEPDTYTVKVDGEEITVTRDELLKGYQRDADYRRKTQAVAEQRKQLEQAQQALIQRLNELGTAQEREPDWTKLADELDPWEYQKRRAAWDADQQRRQMAAQEAQELAQRQYIEAGKRCIEALPEIIPEWSDRARMRTEYEALLRDVPAMYGVPTEQVAAITDPGGIKILRDAVAYARLMESKPKVIEKKKSVSKKSMKAGASVPKQAKAATEQREVRKQLRTAKSVSQERDAFVRLISGG